VRNESLVLDLSFPFAAEIQSPWASWCPLISEARIESVRKGRHERRIAVLAIGCPGRGAGPDLRSCEGPVLVIEDARSGGVSSRQKSRSDLDV
jgi:hypothetical protein